MSIISIFIVIIAIYAPTTMSFEVIFAMNAGGTSHIDVTGIHYEEDNNYYGYRIHWAKTVKIYNVAAEDAILYRTMHLRRTLRYDLAVRGDGKYWLILKFAEIGADASNKRLFDVYLNGHHKVLANFDIFAKAGRQTAHDEFIHFSICNGSMQYKDEFSKVHEKIRVHFSSSDKHETQVSAIVLLKGDLVDISNLQRVGEAMQEFQEFEEKFNCELDGKTT
jgi:hypothetical protein